MPNCPVCGAAYEINQLFCGECGTRLPTRAAMENIPAPVYEPDSDHTPEPPVASLLTEDAPCAEESASEPYSSPSTVQRPASYTPPYNAVSPNPSQQTQNEYAGQTYEQRNAYEQNVSFRQSDVPEKGSPYAPVSTGGFYGALLLFAVPLVGLIFAIVWACGGCKKKNLRNFALGHILYSLTVTLLSIIAGVLIWTACSAVIINALESMGYELVGGNGEVISIDDSAFWNNSEAPAAESSLALYGNGMEQLQQLTSGDYFIRYEADVYGIIVSGTEARLGDDWYTSMSVGSLYETSLTRDGVVYKYDVDRGVYCVSDLGMDVIFGMMSAIDSSVLDMGVDDFNGRELAYETYNRHDSVISVFLNENGNPCGIRVSEDDMTLDLTLMELSDSPDASLFQLPGELQEVSEAEFDEEGFEF